MHPLACPACTAPIAADQRYCLACGERLPGAPRWTRAPAPADESVAEPLAPVARGGLPQPRAVAALTMVLLGFGTLLGAAAGPAAQGAPAARRIVLPAVAQMAAVPVAAAVAQAPAANVVAPDPEPEVAAEPVASAPAPPASTPAPATPKKKTPAKSTVEPKPLVLPVKRAWVLWLAGRPPEESFGAGAPYLSAELRPQGALLTGYHAIGHGSLADGIALLSGQAPNPDTAADCPQRTPFAGRRPRKSDGQAVGKGCVFGAEVPTLLGRMTEAGRTWRVYEQGITAPCALDGPAARRDPAAYFSALLDPCADAIVGLDRLEPDLADPEAAPSLAFLAPAPCEAGVPGTCAPGEPDGLARADAFAREWVPKILASPAFADDGMLVVVFDHDPKAPTEGGGRVGALVVTRFAKPGSAVKTAYNHYALTRTLADLFGVDAPGYAAAATGFGRDVFKMLKTK